MSTTVSYAYARRRLNGGSLPEREAVRVEEMINYFSYDYPKPERADVPFRPTVAVYPTPWNADTKLLHIGIKGYDIETTEKPRANLVFLIDASGSMAAADKLPLLKQAFGLLLDELGPDDMVSIVAYAGGAGVVLEPTPARRKRTIRAALGRLHSGGGTAGSAGLREAYALAEQAFDKDGVNRVILATDGDFNIGISDPDALKRFIVEKRKTGIFLSVLGFGYGNLNDRVMQVLAQNGNGVAAYIDTLREAQKVLVDEASSSLFPIAKDVKIHVEFNPATVAEYRLIGYETRALKREDFNNDKVDAGDIGSGHTVTAIYEITPVGAAGRVVDDLRYGWDDRKPAAGGNGEFAHLKLRYKLPKAKKRQAHRPGDYESARKGRHPSDLRRDAVCGKRRRIRPEAARRDPCRRHELRRHSQARPLRPRRRSSWPAFGVSEPCRARPVDQPKIIGRLELSVAADASRAALRRGGGRPSWLTQPLRLGL